MFRVLAAQHDGMDSRDSSLCFSADRVKSKNSMIDLSKGKMLAILT